MTDSQEKEKSREEKSKGKVEYWMKHREEQKQLESEMQEHNLLLEKLSDGRNNLPEKERERELYHKLNELIDQKKLLGVHKKSEKKAIDEEIEKKKIEITKIENTILLKKHELSTTINKIKGKIEEINCELNKER